MTLTYSEALVLQRGRQDRSAIWTLTTACPVKLSNQVIISPVSEHQALCDLRTMTSSSDANNRRNVCQVVRHFRSSVER
jgi:hypothetical protein